MRKGDGTKREILSTAERLFCQKGYEATSVQDILDVMHASKGGFYHHFDSKEAVLKTLCVQRAERALQEAVDALENVTGEMNRLNTVLRFFMPLRQGEKVFLAMMMPLLDRPEGRALALVYQEALEDAFLPLLTKEMAAATESGVICPPVRNVEGMLLHVVNHCWLRAARELLRCASAQARYDAAELLQGLEEDRRVIEVLLDAPYGSVELLPLKELDEVATYVMREITQ